MSPEIPCRTREVVKLELLLFLQMCELTGSDPNQQLRRLRLSRYDWQGWLAILQGAPLPAYPTLPRLLRHLGYINHRLERIARRHVEGICRSDMIRNDQ